MGLIDDYWERLTDGTNELETGLDPDDVVRQFARYLRSVGQDALADALEGDGLEPLPRVVNVGPGASAHMKGDDLLIYRIKGGQ